ncbi:hypothetical protein EX30DRAFT_395442 [Ascodesmis nigricans]|uniref:ARS-binding protein 1 N-terminal domain-containing protein n=1 Tax=Ascodesmis nigricans TaxID=341454 RepID=A0A4S2MY30_9PEZI|nr:hypothetical protein EX30DRAFT_395442 [Ascodesmis nigricans]
MSSTRPAVAPASPPQENIGEKRKCEETSKDENVALYHYHQANPHLKQRELVDWFAQTFGRKINQSTVSRNLKKARNQYEEDSRQQADPRRYRKHAATPEARQLNHLPLTPPPQPVRNPDIDNQLIQYLGWYRQVYPNASEREINLALKSKAREVYDAQGLKEHIDEDWVMHWKRSIPNLPSPALSGYVSPHARNGTFLDPHSHYNAGSSRASTVEPHSPASFTSAGPPTGLPSVRHLIASSKGHENTPRRNEMDDLSLAIHHVQKQLAECEKMIKDATRRREELMARLQHLHTRCQDAAYGPKLAPIQFEHHE